MSEPIIKTSSRTNWDYLKTLPDDEIDLSDAPELTPEMLARARLLLPGQRTSEATPRPRKTQDVPTVTVPLEMDAALLAWFQAQGEGYEHRMLAALRLYAQAHQTA